MKISRKLTFLKKKGAASEAVQDSELHQRLEQAEWDSFDNSIHKEDAFWKDTWNAIQQQKRRSARIVRLKQTAVAAAMMGVLLGTYLWFGASYRHTPQQPLAAAASYKTITNTTAQAMDVVLEDSSSVMLFPASALRYEAAFPGGKRNIYLDGEAIFKVKQDAARPFTVLSNGIATTVLGTMFKVLAADAGGNTKVYLYQGKVVVRSADTMQVKLQKDYYMAPGDVFSYNHSNGIAALMNGSRKANSKTMAKEDNSAAAVSNWYMFENQELSQVFDQLSAIYNVSIHYNPADLKGLNFIGKIERTDSLGNILKDITLLNNLTVENNGKNYSIRKQ